MSKRELIYLAIPYSWNPEKSYQIANEITAELLEQGFDVFSPVTHFHPIALLMKEEKKQDHDFWMEKDLFFLSKCDKVLIVDIVDRCSINYTNLSKGVLIELAFAEKRGIPINRYSKTILTNSVDLRVNIENQKEMVNRSEFENQFLKDSAKMFLNQVQVPKENTEPVFIQSKGWSENKYKSETDSERGLRFNEGKPKWSLIDFDSLEGIVRVLEYGTKKYEKDNWKKGMPVSEVLESLLRHVFAILRGEEKDKESGLPHIWHVQTNAMFVDYMIKNKPEFNDIKKAD
jgi:nucleoside 2-deoxyribosyltransferase